MAAIPDLPLTESSVLGWLTPEDPSPYTHEMSEFREPPKHGPIPSSLESAASRWLARRDHKLSNTTIGDSAQPVSRESDSEVNERLRTLPYSEKVQHFLLQSRVRVDRQMLC